MTSTVYSVEAADRMTLVTVQDGVPEFKQVMLHMINAPKPGKRTTTGELTDDEPYAAEALEQARALCIGKRVQFSDDLMSEPLQRMAGRMTLANGDDVAAELVKGGLAKVPQRMPAMADKATFEAYQAHQAAAKIARKGVFAPDQGAHIRRIAPFPPVNPEAVIGQLKGKTVKLRIERVPSGSSYLVNAPVDGGFQQLQVCMTGLACPSVTKKDGSGTDQLGVDARVNTERALLHRAIGMSFDGVDAFGNFLCSIPGGKGSFGEDVLAKGFARVLPATLEKSPHREALLVAEQTAKQAVVGVWKEAADAAKAAAAAGAVAGNAAVIAPAAGGAARPGPGEPFVKDISYPGEVDFNGTVVQVLSGDMIVVRKDSTLEYVKVALAGVRAPKVIKRDSEGQQGGPRPAEVRSSYEEFTWEAKEFLRTMFIGSTVSVHVDMGRRYEDTKEVRAMGTVIDYATGSNIAVALLRKGLAKHMLARGDVCCAAAELAAADADARERGVGVHGEESSSTKVTEINKIGEKQARNYLGFLQRGMSGKRPPVWRAVVDMVMSGSSVRVYVPREHFQFSLKLAGIVSPSSGYDGAVPDPFHNESKDFAVLKLQQREVDIMVETVDRGGNFIGYINVGNKSFSAMIVGAGLATCSSADRTLNANELLSAEAAAKAAKLAIWSDTGALPARQQRLAAQAAARNVVKTAHVKVADAAFVPVTISEVAAGAVYFIPQTAETTAQRETVAELLAECTATEAKNHSPKKNEIVAVYFREDKTWNRGKVTDVYTGERRAQVLFVDFGTSQEVSFKDLRAIPAGVEFETLRSAGLAVHAPLAFLKPRVPNDEWAEVAVAAAWEYVVSCDETRYARAEYTGDNGKTTFYSVATSVKALTLSEQLLRDGAALVDQAVAPVDAEGTTKHMKAQQVARAAHAGMWHFGDVDGSDDEDE
jgi:staphylococcal nuclease domain-containing protein 1